MGCGALSTIGHSVNGELSADIGAQTTSRIKLGHVLSRGGVYLVFLPESYTYVYCICMY